MTRLDGQGVGEDFDPHVNLRRLDQALSQQQQALFLAARREAVRTGFVEIARRDQVLRPSLCGDHFVAGIVGFNRPENEQRRAVLAGRRRAAVEQVADQRAGLFVLSLVECGQRFVEISAFAFHRQTDRVGPSQPDARHQQQPPSRPARSSASNGRRPPCLARRRNHAAATAQRLPRRVDRIQVEGFGPTSVQPSRVADGRRRMAEDT